MALIFLLDFPSIQSEILYAKFRQVALQGLLSSMAIPTTDLRSLSERLCLRL